MPTALALDFFLPSAPRRTLTPLGEGNINDTWRVELPDGEKMVLQRLHPAVFPDPAPVMHNLRLVTSHLDRVASPGPPVFFRLLANPEGQDHFLDSAGHCWRLLSYIDHTRTLPHLHTPAQAGEIGRLLGQFHLLVAGIAPASLADPLPDFHVTPRYLDHFDATCGNRPAKNREEAYCLAVIAEQRQSAALLEQARANLSVQVIHGDPKAANFLFAADSDRAVSLIDFDTVKPGLLLHDLGDCLRSCCNRLGEACDDPAAVVFAPDLFQALMAGYWEQAAHLLTPTDQALLVEAVKLISFELGLRFFTDHCTGDTYFKVSRPGLNLHRAMIQFRLNQSIQEQQDHLEQRFRSLAAAKDTTPLACGPHRT
jgi:Ser/Thr protein kinase RdoA (MazF antagonist)